MLGFLHSPTLMSIYDHWKNHSLDLTDLCGKAMSLLFNMLSRLVIIFLPRSKHLLISWLQSPSAAFGAPQKIKSDAISTVSPSMFPMYSAYKLNNQGDNIQPWCTPFPIWNQSVVPCPVLTVASWPAYRFFKRQVKCFGNPITLRIFHNLLWSTHSKPLA